MTCLTAATIILTLSLRQGHSLIASFFVQYLCSIWQDFDSEIAELLVLNFARTFIICQTLLTYLLTCIHIGPAWRRITYKLDYCNEVRLGVSATRAATTAIFQRRCSTGVLTATLALCTHSTATPTLTSINKKHLKNVGPIRHCEPPHAACSNFTLPFTRCRYCRHHYQDEPKPAIAIAQAACDSSDTWWMAM